jgi:LmbE family N-acetylglucosaminyl deacetylase
MQHQPTIFERRSADSHSLTTSESFAEIFTDWKPGRESFLFFAPHDDDSAISVGLLIREARRNSIPVRIVVVTDGRNGYVALKDRETIVERRRAETLQSYALLGVPESEIVFLNFPDGDLQNYFGRRRAVAGDPADEHGYTGLENHFVRELRRRTLINGSAITPTRVFVPSLADYHQDHVAVAREVPICLFHALGGIWPECGDALSVAPMLYWHCVYCRFPDNQEPNIRIKGSPEAFAAKLKSIEAYNSQGQIAGMVEGLRKAPPVEYLLEETFSLFQAGSYDHCFKSQ